MQVGAELALGALPNHGRHHLVAHDQHPQVGAAGLLDVFLHEQVRFEATERLDDALGGLLGFAQHHAHALRALEELDDHRRPADGPDKVLGLLGLVCKRRLGQAQPLLGE